MPPKKKEQQKMSLGDFLSDAGFGGSSNWADEVEENYVAGTQPLPASDRPRMGAGASTSMWQDRGYSVRESAPVSFPERPPYTAHLGNLNYDVTDEAVKEFFEGCEVASVRLIEDRETMRPKGFGYVEFATPEGLTKALTLDGESFGGRTVRIKIADPPRGGDSGRGDTIREMGDWTRKGPLPDAPRGGGRQNSDFGERRAPRDPAASFESRPARDFTWERHGPLAPVPGQQGPGSRDGSRPRAAGGQGMGERSESYRGNDRRQSPAAWGEGRSEGGPRGEFQERPPRPERVPTAAEKDGKWRERMRPDQAAKSPEVSTPPSPALSSAAPAQGGRPRLNLAKRTVSEANPTSPSAGSDSKASPFGAARPIDTAAREREIEEKKIQAAQEKQEAEEKAKEEKRIAKEEAAKAEAAREEAAKEEAAKAEAAKAAKAEEDAKAPAPVEAEVPKAEGETAQKGTEEQKPAPRTREPREPREPRENPKSRANESSSWRSAGGERGPRGPPSGPRGGRGGQARGGRNEGRGPRANGQAAQPAQAAQAAQSPASPTTAEPETPTADEDGWTTVIMPKKGRGGRV